MVADPGKLNHRNAGDQKAYWNQLKYGHERWFAN